LLNNLSRWLRNESHERTAAVKMLEMLSTRDTGSIAEDVRTDVGDDAGVNFSRLAQLEAVGMTYDFDKHELKFDADEPITWWKGHAQ